MKYLKTLNEKCNGCNACMSVCSQLYFKEDNREKSAITVTALADNQYELNACDQCQDCVAECPTQALTVSKQGVVLLNKNLCINCLACVAVCPTNSMRTYPGGLVPFKCIACVSCSQQCPTAALAIASKEEKS